jgi:hypothetical protein
VNVSSISILERLDDLQRSEPSILSIMVKLRLRFTSDDIDIVIHTHLRL